MTFAMCIQVSLKLQLICMRKERDRVVKRGFICLLTLQGLIFLLAKRNFSYETENIKCVKININSIIHQKKY